MKRLLTIVTPGIAEACTELKASHVEYAARHGYDYECADTLHWPEHAASFSKVWQIHQALQDPATEIVIWADADVGFTNMTVDIGKLIEPDWWLAGYAQKNNACVGGRPFICAGLLVIRNGDYARKFWTDVLATEPGWHHDNIINKVHGWEQWYFDEQLVARGFEKVRGCTTSEIGGFSREFWNDGAPWVPGAPTVHISDRGNWGRRRRAWVNNYMPKIVR